MNASTLILLINFVCFCQIWAIQTGGRNRVQCPEIKLKNGRTRYRSRGRFVKFVCNTGYILAGEKYNTCVHGEWDNISPKCVRATCYPVKTPVNLLIYPSHGGAVLNFYCKSNFQLRGSRISSCDGRLWDNPLPSCLPTNSTPPLKCDFEDENLCGWNHDLNHDFEWKRLNYKTPSGSIGTGPSFDHTKGENRDGYYMYIESSSRNENDTARLVSPVYNKTTSNTCFEFFYHMYGITTGTLRVYLRKASKDWSYNSSLAIFSKSGNQGNHWYRALIDLGTIDDEYQIIIEGVRGSGYVSDIAIDDVKITENCVYEEESFSTTESDGTTEPLLTVESCEDRCGNQASENQTLMITCDCDDKCYENNRCCPDYINFCVLGTSMDDFMEDTTEIFSTIRQFDTDKPTILPESATVEENRENGTTSIKTPTFSIRPTTTTPNTITFPPSTLPTTKKRTTLTTTSSRKVSVVTRPILHTKKVVPLTKATIPPIVFITNPSTAKIYEKTPAETTRLYKKKITDSKIIYMRPDDTNDLNNDIMAFPTTAYPKESSEPKEEQKETVMNYYDKNDDETSKSYKKERIIIEGKTEGVATTTRLIVLVIGIVLGAMIGLLGVTFLVRRYRLASCKRLGGIRQSFKGDSQSDVRFLTSDETLDFSLEY